MALYAVRFASQSLPKTPTPAFPKEYERSKVTVPIPGPQSKKLFAEMSKHQVRLRISFIYVRLFHSCIGFSRVSSFDHVHLGNLHPTLLR